MRSNVRSPGGASSTLWVSKRVAARTRSLTQIGVEGGERSGYKRGTRRDHGPKTPRVALAIFFDDRSVPSTSTAVPSGAVARRQEASEYASSPVAHPALQARIAGRP